MRNERDLRQKNYTGNRSASQTRRRSDEAYVEGNTVRQFSVVPAPREMPDRHTKGGEVPQRPRRQADKHVSRQKSDRQRETRRRESSTPARQAQKSRVLEQHPGFGYVIVLGICAAVTLWICAGYLQLQAENTRSVKQIAALENQLTALKTENDDEYNRLVSSVDLNSIRETAINELGMVYANPDQVVLYDSQANDYVRQYKEIPQEESSLLDELLGSR